MAQTLQTTLVFPITFVSLLGILAVGPILYSASANASHLQNYYSQQAQLNKEIYLAKDYFRQGHTFQYHVTSPEKLHMFLFAIEDSAKLLYQGVKK